MADVLDESRPVQRREHPHAGDGVANRHLQGRFHLRLLPDHRVGAALGFQRFGQLRPGRRHRRRAIAQASQQLDDKRRRERLGQHRLGSPSPQTATLGRRLLFELEHDLLRARAIVARFEHLVGQRAQALDQRQAQHDGDCPDLTDAQGLRFLIGRDERAQHVGVDTVVRVRDQFRRQGVHARIPGMQAVGEARQFEVVPRRQVGAHLANLVADDIEVVAEPVFRWQARVVGAEAERPVGRFEALFGRVQPRQQATTAPTGLALYPMGVPEVPGVFDQAVRGIQTRVERNIDTGVLGRDRVGPRKRGRSAHWAGWAAGALEVAD